MLGNAPQEQSSNAQRFDPANHVFDPRTLLTIKSSTKKAVHITSFLSEATKKRRQSRKKKFVVGQSQGDAQLVFTPDEEHPYSGISIEEWSAANCRVMADLIKTGDLALPDVEYYLAYTVQIYEHAQRYEWEGLLDYDHQYRERQAEHGFPWGSNTGNMELNLLQTKRTEPAYRDRRPFQQESRSQGQRYNNYNRAYSSNGRKDYNRPRQHQDQDQVCRQYINSRGNCPYGDRCIFVHPTTAAGATAPKN